MPSQVQLRVGGERSEEDMEVVELEAQEEDDGTEESEEEDGPGPPLQDIPNDFPLSFLFMFYFHTGMMGSRWGSPTITAQAGSG